VSQRINQGRIYLLLCLVMMGGARSWAQEAAPSADIASPEVIPLWPNGAPGAKGDTENDKPTLTIHLPSKDRATGTAIVICPGGGYGFLAMDHEGEAIARWLNSIGVAGFVLKYRHRGTGYGHPAPMLDAQRAMRMVRSRAKEWHLNRSRIGIIGFSAGGHLASTVGTHFDMGDPLALDPIDRQSCRPDFMVLVYPVITLIDAPAHRGSRKNLLGKQPDEKLVALLSNERQVTSQTPPTFLVHTCEDTGVPAENSLLFFQALRRAHIAAEMHIFACGHHGFGLGKKGEPNACWPDLCEKWMKKVGLIKSNTP